MSIFSKAQRRKTRGPAGFWSAGFSLVELMVAMGVASIVMAGIYSVYASLTRSYTTQNVAAEVQQVMRTGIDLMAEDIMMAGLDKKKSEQSAFTTVVKPIEEARSDKIRIKSDRNTDGDIDIDSDMEIITYLYVPGSNRLDQILYEGEAAEDQEVFIDNVIDFSFTYLAADGSDLGDPVPLINLPDIRTVVITLTVEEPAGRAGTVDRTYTTRVRCRNMGLN
jgi:prepilin-type N-terminal cleavage/methylation domain-containing protein